MTLVSRVVTILFKQWRSATDSLISDVIKELEELESLPSYHDTTHKRTYFGIILISIMVNPTFPFEFVTFNLC